MKTENKHIRFSSFLAAILLFQWGFAAIHVFTSHTEFHSQNKVDNSNEAIYGIDYECDLCAKLNVKPATFFFAPKIALNIIAKYVVTSRGDFAIVQPFLGLNLRRGPPSTP
ncbi:hypothetical protein [Flagellimonas sp. 2504JD4-2]